jgi:hypothetical protein
MANIWNADYQQHLLQLMLHQHDEDKSATANPGLTGLSPQPPAAETSSDGVVGHTGYDDGRNGTGLVSPAGA